MRPVPASGAIPYKGEKMRTFVWGACAIVALGLGSAALAADDPVAAAYGNTVVVTNAKGETTKTWYKADHTYTGEDGKGQKFQGTWTLAQNDTQFCITPVLPAGAPAPKEPIKQMCAEFKGAHKVGDKWTQNDFNNQPVTVEIKAGM